MRSSLQNQSKKSIIGVVAGSFLLAVMLCTTIAAQVFTPGGRYPTGTPWDITAADFDGDNDTDLAISQRYEDSMYVHLNDGFGGFAEVRKFGLARESILESADFNNDGHYDLVTYGDAWLDDTTWVWGTLVYLNNGDTSFSISYHDTICSKYFTTADFDGDTYVDLAVFNYVYMPQYGDAGIYIFSGYGDGTFADPVMLDSTATGRLEVSDVDDDGDIDLLFVTASDALCRLNNGDGSFAEPISTLSSGRLGMLTHLDGDQFPDMLRKETYGCSGYGLFRLGDGDGTFSGSYPAWTTAGLLSGISLVAADFSYDGHPDIALYAPEQDYIDVGFNDGRLNFRVFHDAIPMTAGGGWLVAADFDADGDPDLAGIGLDDTLAVAFSLGAQHDRTLVVPDDYATVQAAVAAAWNLDTILVCPGIYYGEIDFGSKNLVLMSSDCFGSTRHGNMSEALSRAEATILDGGGTERVLTFDDFEDDRSVVMGFTIQNGYAEGYGGAIYCYDTAAPTITNNIIRNNYSTSAAGAIFVNTGAVTISHNLIVNNSSGFIGGALYVSSPTAKITNNTIYGNSTEEGGGGLYLGYGTPLLSSNIFWGNSSTTNGQEIECGTAELPMTYSVVQGGWPGVGNINVDPMFVDPANYNFNLTAGSPCVDAGDPSLPLDPDGSVADIGAYYFPHTVGLDDDASVNLPSHFELLQNYPNPFNMAATIEYYLSERSRITINIYNLLGQKVKTLVDREEAAGSYTVTWDGTNTFGQSVSTGAYFYRFQAGDFVKTRKMLLLK